MTTLKEAIEAIRSIKTISILKDKESVSIVDELLGKYKGIIPKGKTSSQFIRNLRNSLYGKIR